MDHHDHIRLLRGGIPEPGGTWADLGSGTGAFTLALAEIIGPHGEIFSVDRDRRALERQGHRMLARFPEVKIHYVTADYTRPLSLPPMDGIVMANTLHFLPRKDAVLQLVSAYLKPGGRLLLVEYNVDRGNQWVPYPFSYRTWEGLSQHNGFQDTQKLASRPSRFLGEIYSAVSRKPG